MRVLTAVLSRQIALASLTLIAEVRGFLQGASAEA
jgi:hypothetical protein